MVHKLNNDVAAHRTLRPAQEPPYTGRNITEHIKAPLRCQEKNSEKLMEGPDRTNPSKKPYLSDLASLLESLLLAALLTSDFASLLSLALSVEASALATLSELASAFLSEEASALMVAVLVCLGSGLDAI